MPINKEPNLRFDAFRNPGTMLKHNWGNPIKCDMMSESEGKERQLIKVSSLKDSKFNKHGQAHINNRIIGNGITNAILDNTLAHQPHIYPQPHHTQNSATESILRRENINLRQRVNDLEYAIQREKENYGVLERQIMDQNELVRYCRKFVDEEWEIRKNRLMLQVTSKYSEDIEGIINMKIKEHIKDRKQKIDISLLQILKNKFKEDLEGEDEERKLSL